MRQIKQQKQSRRGMALITALVFISISVLVLIALMGRYMQQRIHVDRFEDYYLVFEAAEAAVEFCVTQTELGFPGVIGLEDWEPEFDHAGSLLLPDCSADGVLPATLESMPGIGFIGFTYDWFGDGRDSNGDGIVDSLEEFGMFSVHTRATGNGQTRQLEAVYSSADINVWNNAIFAGSGQSGGLINGNVRVHGSVHLLGDNLLMGDTAVEVTEALEMSGTALIANNYDGMPLGLQQRVPALPRRMYLGEDVATLNARLRVKRGLVGINGNAHIGKPWVTGSGIKGPMDGTFVNDGWTGNQVTDDGDRGIPSSSRYYSDNGHQQRYDLGNRISMPYLDDDWREPDGSRVMDPNTGTWYTHEDYFTQVLLADPAIPNDGIFTGNLVLNARSQAANARYWNATTGQYLTGNNAINATPGATDDYLKFNPLTNVMTMNGQIRINGNLTFTGQGNQTTIHYSGRAAFLVDGEVTIDTDLLACNNGNPSNTTLSFPVNNIIGIGLSA